MKIQLTITSLICLSLASCVDFEQSHKQISKVEDELSTEHVVEHVTDDSSKYALEVEKALMIKRSGKNLDQDAVADFNQSTKEDNKQSLEVENNLSANNYRSAVGGNYMTLEITGLKNGQGNPLYSLNLYVKGELVEQYLTVTGRAYTQNKNRNQSGTEAPLPDGNYSVSFNTVPATHVEVGDRFLPIRPQFSTNRTFLGIHYDPSYNKSNGEDGTAGCIALTNRKDFSQVLQFINTYQPQFLTVDIQ